MTVTARHEVLFVNWLYVPSAILSLGQSGLDILTLELRRVLIDSEVRVDEVGDWEAGTVRCGCRCWCSKGAKHEQREGKHELD
jgi:hypothetical protein